MKMIGLAIAMVVSSAALASYPVEIKCKATSNNAKIKYVEVNANDYGKNSRGVPGLGYGQLDINPRGCFATGGSLTQQQYEALAGKTGSVTVTNATLNCGSGIPQDPNAIKGVIFTMGAGMNAASMTLPSGQVDFYDCTEVGSLSKGADDLLRKLGPNIGS
jgi:hypothetical protein